MAKAVAQVAASEAVAHATGFSRLCDPLASDARFVQIPSLDAWANLPTGDDRLEEVADLMDWLPSSRDQQDPIHGASLEERSDVMGKKDEFFRAGLGIHKLALASLRRFEGHPALVAGPHDFTEAARGAALFASRRAAYEVLLSDCGFWCSVMRFYGQGHWPCGILSDRTIVVL